MITEDDTAEFKISWETGPLVPRPGFGFYPDYVWDWLDKSTEVKLASQNERLSITKDGVGKKCTLCKTLYTRSS